MTIAVVTPALPSRGVMLAECVASIAAQTLPPVVHLVGIDHEKVGTARTKTRLCHATDAKWVATLEDDDLADNYHLSVLAERAAGGADIIYSWCRVEGRDGWNPNSPFDADRLRRGNFIPSTALIRRELIVALGGWKDSADVPHGWDDWNFWLRALDAGARFACVPQVTWTYRFHGGNKTLNGEESCF